MKASDLFAGGDGVPADQFPDPEVDAPTDPIWAAQHVVLGGGCFWCTEAVFAKLDGVTRVVSGYAGGTAETANYEAVCSGMTDHAEVIRVDFDPSRITYGQILKVFFAVAHDPTQLNRQGNDLGRQYRSAIFYGSVNQEQVARAYIQQLEAAKVFDRPIVTTVEPLIEFYEAEAYHQDFATRNPNQPYVAAVAAPKVKKLEKSFADKLKKG